MNTNSPTWSAIYFPFDLSIISLVKIRQRGRLWIAAGPGAQLDCPDLKSSTGCLLSDRLPRQTPHLVISTENLPNDSVHWVRSANWGVYLGAVMETGLRYFCEIKILGMFLCCSRWCWGTPRLLLLALPGSWMVPGRDSPSVQPVQYLTGQLSNDCNFLLQN